MTAPTNSSFIQVYIFKTVLNTHYIHYFIGLYLYGRNLPCPMKLLKKIIMPDLH